MALALQAEALSVLVGLAIFPHEGAFEELASVELNAVI